MHPDDAAATAPFRPTWVCPTEADWLRFIDLERRIAPMRLVLLLSLITPGTAVVAHTGGWSWVVLLAALTNHVTINRLSARRPATPRRGVWVVVSFQVVLLAVVSVTGGLHSPCLPWLAVPATILATRYRVRVVAVGVVLTVLAAAVVTTLTAAYGPEPVSYPYWVQLLCLTGLTAACGASSLALQSAETESRLAADVDALTGLLNRKPLALALDRMLADSARTGRSAAVLVCDIDHFKKVNDDHGHAKGDEVLRGVAARLRGGARSDAKIFRFGGEEFVVLVPEVDCLVAAQVAERLRAQVAAHPVEGLVVTMSVGVAVAEPGQCASGAALLEAADAALYAAKDSGRNRVCSAAGLDAVVRPTRARPLEGTHEVG